MKCVGCERENRADARFCDGCGGPLVTAAPEVSSRSDRAPLLATEIERRQITILFCDLVESVSISTRMDPEDFGQLMQRYEAAGEAAMEAFGGHIAQYLGDGLVVYFGYPQAHERAAEMAVRAGLALLENVARLDHEEAEHLAVRVGIHTGEVVVQEMGRGDRRDPLALGDVVNIAARAQSVAEPGTVCITGTTHRLVDGMFTVDTLGFPPMKGVRKPLELLRVTDTDERAVSGARGRSRFVGRTQELALLEAAWVRTRAGAGQVVHISGEPGIGKSRLVEELRSRLAREDHLWLECGGAPHRQHTPFATIAQMTTQSFAWKPDHPPDARLDELDAGLVAAGIIASRVTPLLAPILGLAPEPGRYPGELRSAEQQREDLQTAMVEWLVAAARDRPLVILTEDLHWLDPSSLQLLDRMADAIVDEPVLMIQTARSEYESPLADAPHHRQITVPRLDETEIAELVAHLSPDHTDRREVARITARADGVPLFVEEVLRSVAEDGTDVGAVPPTLRDALAARLDRLGDAKAVAQTASVLGMEFSAPFLADVAGVDVVALRGGMDRLVEHDVIRPVGSGATAAYRFTHALVQETAYASLLRARRLELHGRASEALIDHFPTIADRRPELLAHHLANAGLATDAVAAWERAAVQAFAASAMLEAESHVDAAIDLLDQLPDDDERASTEMRLQMLRGRVSSATHGIASAQTRQSYARAMEIGTSLDDSPRLIGLLFGAWGGAFSHGAIDEAGRHLDELLRLSAESDDTSMAGWVCYAEAATVFARGDLDRAATLLDRIFGSNEDHASDAMKFGLDLAAIALTHYALVAMHGGRVGDAMDVIERYREQAETSSPWEQSMVLMAACCLYIGLGDVERVRAGAARLRVIAEDASLPTFLAWADLYLGWALTTDDRSTVPEVEEGLARLRTGLAAYLATDQRTGHPGYLKWIAAAQLRLGRTDDAWETINQAATALPEELVDVAGILLVRGQILAADSSLADAGETAVGCVEQSIAHAREFGSVTQELTGATVAARLRVGTRDAGLDRARVEALLERVVGGETTAVVCEARAVLTV